MPFIKKRKARLCNTVDANNMGVAVNIIIQTVRYMPRTFLGFQVQQSQEGAGNVFFHDRYEFPSPVKAVILKTHLYKDVQSEKQLTVNANIFRVACQMLEKARINACFDYVIDHCVFYLQHSTERNPVVKSHMIRHSLPHRTVTQRQHVFNH